MLVMAELGSIPMVISSERFMIKVDSLEADLESAQA